MGNQETSSRELTLLRSYIRDGKLMQFATISAGGAPRLAHCWYAADDALNLVFLSRADRRHSCDIGRDGRVAGGIIAVQLDGLGQKVRGVTFQGMAKQVDEAGLDAAYATYRTRWPQVQDMISVDVIRDGTTDNRLWMITPTAFILFDEVNFPESPLREVASW